jgi:hypothetical protein
MSHHASSPAAEIAGTTGDIAAPTVAAPARKNPWRVMPVHAGDARPARQIP